MKSLVIGPNRPVTVALLDVEGEWKERLNHGTYKTTTGEIFNLPRPAVVALNILGPAAGEPITILQSWTGRRKDAPQWTVERARPEHLGGASAPEPAARPLETTGTKEAPISAPTPIRKPAPTQPRLFDTRGNGTTGPAPIVWPQQAPRRSAGRPYVEPIPANVAVREILAFIQVDPNTRNWGAEARQDLASTIIIAAYKAGHIGLWERGE